MDGSALVWMVAHWCGGGRWLCTVILCTSVVHFNCMMIMRSGVVQQRHMDSRS